MVLLTHGQVNRIIVTVTDRGVLQNPSYLFVFTDEATNQRAAIVLEDQSQFKHRYNLFLLPSGVLTGKDWFTYQIYEQESTTNLDPELSGAIVETGRAFMLPYVANPFISHETENTFKAYGE